MHAIITSAQVKGGRELLKGTSGGLAGRSVNKQTSASLKLQLLPGLGRTVLGKGLDSSGRGHPQVYLGPHSRNVLCAQRQAVLAEMKHCVLFHIIKSMSGSLASLPRHSYGKVFSMSWSLARSALLASLGTLLESELRLV